MPPHRTFKRWKTVGPGTFSSGQTINLTVSVPSGTDRHLSVVLYDASGAPSHVGRTTINVTGPTTVTISLNSVTPTSTQSRFRVRYADTIVGDGPFSGSATYYYLSPHGDYSYYSFTESTNPNNPNLIDGELVCAEYSSGLACGFVGGGNLYFNPNSPDVRPVGASTITPPSTFVSGWLRVNGAVNATGGGSYPVKSADITSTNIKTFVARVLSNATPLCGISTSKGALQTTLTCPLFLQPAPLLEVLHPA